MSYRRKQDGQPTQDYGQQRDNSAICQEAVSDADLWMDAADGVEWSTGVSGTSHGDIGQHEEDESPEGCDHRTAYGGKHWSVPPEDF
jgi:hypothetical protein